MKIEKLNPSLKAATVMAAVIMLSCEYLVSLNVAVFAFSLILLVFFSNAKLKSMLKILMPAFAAAFGMFLMGLYYAKGNSVTAIELDSVSSVPYAVRAAMSQNMYTAMQLSTRLLAFAGLGILYALTTDGEYFVHSLMHQCRLSPKFAYGILAAFHMMPGMAREYRNVRIAFEARGIKVRSFSIKVLFTMLVNSIRWSESMAMAMESKGFAGNKLRTYYSVPKVHWYDIVCCVILLGSIALGMIFLKY